MNRDAAVVAAVLMLVALPVVGSAATTFFVTSGDVSISANKTDNSPTVVVGGGPDIDLNDATGPPDEIEVTTKSGNMTIRGTADTTLTIQKNEIEGTETIASSVDVSNGNVTVDPSDKPAATFTGGLDSIRWRDPTVDDGTRDFRYSGSSGTNTITIRGVPANTQLGAADTDHSTLQDVSTSDSNGNVTFSGLPNSQHTIQIQTSSGGPSLSDGRPSGNVSTEPTTLKVNVSDPDFSYDNVDVTFDVDGSTVGTTTLGSNGTASVSVSNQDFVGGNHTVDVTATDDYGATDSLSYDFTVPSTLEIRNESAPSNLVDNATVDITFYYESGGAFVSENRTATNGTVNMTGLPVSKPLVASAEANGFRDRRIFIQSIYQQQKIYLLPKSVQFTRTTFKLKDYTGEFPEDTTVLIVERTFNGSYDTVLGDYFGATGEFPGELAYNTRHRLTLLNTETGKTRDLGTYTPLASGEQDLAVSVSGTVDPISSDAELSTAPSTGLLPAGDVTLSVNLRDNGENISSYNVSFIRVNQSGNFTLKTVNRTSSGLIRETINLSGAEGEELRVVSEYSTSAGVQKRRTKSFGVVIRNSPPPILGELTALKNLLPEQDREPFTTAVAILITLLATAGVASSARLAPETIGAFSLGFLTIFGVIGWIGFDLLFVGLVVMGSFTILRRGV